MPNDVAELQALVTAKDVELAKLRADLAASTLTRTGRGLLTRTGH